MFLVIEGVGFFAVVDGVPVGLTIQQYADAHDKAKGTVPDLHLPRESGQILFNFLLRKTAAAVETSGS